MQKVIVAVTGASGVIYAARVIEKLMALSDVIEELALVFTDNGKKVWKYELKRDIVFSPQVKIYDNNNLFAPMASGSAGYNSMVIVPCTMGTIGRIASGVSNDLIARTADVMLKERRRLVLVPRELPYNLIHLQNMTLVAQAGGIVLPASPSFYSFPSTIEDLIDTVVDRVVELLGFNISHYRWGEKK
ncbi:MAG TPA: 3-octaprenyl-4-hydroxybenzoate carboxy-lyase [Bacteroidales bacterium]|nr:3-octaprenyl-4-hydroxybenzoate carboxy-lyase [Bacteroidales bacterium]